MSHCELVLGNLFDQQMFAAIQNTRIHRNNSMIIVLRILIGFCFGFVQICDCSCSWRLTVSGQQFVPVAVDDVTSVRHTHTHAHIYTK